MDNSLEINITNYSNVYKKITRKINFVCLKVSIKKKNRINKTKYEVCIGIYTYTHVRASL